jgi:hypothetical protein
MMRFFDYMKKHDVWTKDEYDYVRFKELYLTGDIQINGTRDRPDRFKLICDIGAKLFDVKPTDAVYSNFKTFEGVSLNNPELIRKGLHIFRLIMSRYRYEHQRDKAFETNGLIITEDYLKEDYPEMIAKECETYPLVTYKTNQNLIVDATTPGLSHLRDECGFKELILSYIHGSHLDDAHIKFRRNTFVQRVDNKPDDGDVQKVFHTDIFFPAIKYWYFPGEVKEEYGPFQYVENSVDLNEKLLDFYYEQSILISEDKWDRSRDKSHREGSMRILNEEIDKLGLKRRSVPVKANTLVVANVGGFHARGHCTVPHIRNAVHGSIRIDRPFE